MQQSDARGHNILYSISVNLRTLKDRQLLESLLAESGKDSQLLHKLRVFLAPESNQSDLQIGAKSSATSVTKTASTPAASPTRKRPIALQELQVKGAGGGGQVHPNVLSPVNVRPSECPAPGSGAGPVSAGAGNSIKTSAQKALFT